MTKHITRTCPICGNSFTPIRITGVACSPPCTKRTKKFRETIKAYNTGKKNITPKTLEAVMKLLEADEVIAAQQVEADRQAEADRKVRQQRQEERAQRRAQRILDAELEDEEAEREERNAYAAQLALERRWMSEWRDAKLRMIARGHRPAWVTSKLTEEAYQVHPHGLPPLTP